MTDFEPIDLSPLDPERDPRRWAKVADTVRLRMEAALLQRTREPDPFAVLTVWARPILAAAAVALLVLGSAAVWVGGAGVSRASEARRLAYLAESSVVHGRTPTGAQVVNAIIGRGAR
jgi:predicted NBD/HSP70 family sugar kinase